LPFLERVEKRSPIGRTHAHRRSLKKTKHDPKKTRQRRSLEEDAVRRKYRFTPAESLHIQLGGHTIRKGTATGPLVRIPGIDEIVVFPPTKANNNSGYMLITIKVNYDKMFTK
jgi:hypothetical protein